MSRSLLKRVNQLEKQTTDLNDIQEIPIATVNSDNITLQHRSDTKEFDSRDEYENHLEENDLKGDRNNIKVIEVNFIEDGRD